jgi:hypothetical protein
MRAPVPDGVRGLGLAVGAAGVAFIAVQLGRTQVKQPWYDHRVAQVGIGLIVVGILFFLMGAYMREKDREDSANPGFVLNKDKRIGVLMRGRARLEIDDMTIRHQDTSLDTEDDTEVKGKRLTIE